MNSKSRKLHLLALLAIGSLQTSGLSAGDVARLIDEHIAAGWQELGATPSQVCNDETFARRIYLDLAGRIPTVPELTAFLSSPTESRRAQLVDRLLASDDHARHMGEVFDVVLMGRGGEKAARRRKENHWHGYLRTAFGENRPWNDVVREILLARPAGEVDRGSVWFLYERNNDHQAIAEAVAANVFGVRIDCAQCHDHMSVEEIQQLHYWGLVSFFNRGKNVTTPQGPRVAESAVGGFAKFTNLSGDASDALLTFLGANVVIDEPRPDEGTEVADSDEFYVSATVEGKPIEPRVPKFSRRQQFVDEIVDRNDLIPRAMVNRVWALLMGRGLVHPVNEMDSMHEPSHPSLLDALAEDFAASGFDVRRLIRGIVLSRPYQLDGRPAGSAADESLFAWALAKPLTAEQYYRSMLIAVDGNTDLEKPDVMAEFQRVFPDVFPQEKVANFKQSLFLSNHPAVQSICARREAGTAAQMLALEDPAAHVRLAYRAALQRSPGEGELSACTDFLDARQDKRDEAVSQLLWTLLTSAEFRINH